MGNASSVPPASAEFLSNIAGSVSIPLSDPKWKQLLALPSTALASFDPTEVQGHIRPHTASLGRWMVLSPLHFSLLRVSRPFLKKLASFASFLSIISSSSCSLPQFTDSQLSETHILALPAPFSAYPCHRHHCHRQCCLCCENHFKRFN